MTLQNVETHSNACLSIFRFIFTFFDASRALRVVRFLFGVRLAIAPKAWYNAPTILEHRPVRRTRRIIFEYVNKLLESLRRTTFFYRRPGNRVEIWQ